MAEPAQKHPEIEPDIKPNLHVIDGVRSDSDNINPKELSDKESNPDSPSTDSVEDQEEKGGGPEKETWKNKTTKETDSKQSAKKGGKLKFLKKKGPLAGILLTLVGFGGGISILGSPVWLFSAIMGKGVPKFNTQEVSLTTRAHRLLKSKMSTLTSGECNLIKIICRYKRPSNRLLSQMNKNGIAAYDDAGNLIKEKKLWPNKRPKTYIFTSSSGKKTPINSDELYDFLVKNPEFRSSVHKSTRTRFASLADSVFQKIKLKFKLKTSNRLKGVKNADDVAKAVDDEVKLDLDTKATKGGDADAAARKIISDEVDINTKKIVSYSKGGDTTGTIAAILCFGMDVPGLIIKAERAFQLMQLLKYGMTFFSAFGAIKAGDATPEQVSAIGTALTKVVAQKSAMDSFGMNYIFNNSTKSLSGEGYKKLIPGSNSTKRFGSISLVGSSQLKKDACNALTNPFTGEAINAALSASGGLSMGATLMAASINIAISSILGYLINTLVPPLIDEVLTRIDVNDLLLGFFGDFTSNLEGEPMGDGIVSSLAHTLSQTGNAGANMALSVEDAIAYDNLSQQVQLAYAEEDRATKSPFDISSPNTLLGSFASQFVPYIMKSSSSIGSVSNSLSTLLSTVAGSFSSVLQLSIADAEAVKGAEYMMCEDPAIKDVAAGPFCNVIYGVPVKYLDKDPVTVVNELSGTDINDETGEIIADSDMATWIETCTDGRTDNLMDCQIKDPKTANYALFMIDKRAAEAMDGEDPGLEEAYNSGDEYYGLYNYSDINDSITDNSEVLESSYEDMTTEILNMVKEAINNPAPKQTSLIDTCSVNNTIKNNLLCGYSGLGII